MDTYAKLTAKDEVFELSLEKENQKSTIVYKDTETGRVLKELAAVLEFPNVETMLKNSQTGDDSAYYFERNLDTEGFRIDTEEIKKNKGKISERTTLDMSTEVENELKQNALNDIAAAALDCVYEHLAAQVLRNLQDLVVYKLILTSDELKTHTRLVEIFAQNAGIIDIEVKIE